MVKPFYDIVNSLYHLVMDHVPQALQERPIASAFVLGYAGGYGLMSLAQLASRPVINRVAQVDEKWLPRLEKLYMWGIPIATVIYGFVDPKGARDIMSNHPVYTSGMIGVWLGGSTAAYQDLRRRERLQKTSL